MKVVVIGAGIVGLASAYELAKDGHEVTVVDAGHAGSATHGSAAKIALAETTPVPAPGMVLQGLKWMLKSDSPLYVRPSLAPSFLRFMLTMARHCTASDHRRALQVHLEMASTCLDVLDSWVDEGLDYEMHSKGVLLVFEHLESLHERQKVDDVFAQFGMEPEVLDASALHQREPVLSDRCQHGLFYSDDRQVEPDSLVDALRKRLLELGATIQEDTRVTGFAGNAEGVRAVLTRPSGDGTTGRLPADVVVLAAGVWTGRLSAQLGAPLPIRSGRGYSVDYFPSPVPLSTPLTFEDAHVAVTPLDGRLRLAGTMEFGGMDDEPNPKRIDAIKRAAAEGFAAWDGSAPHVEPWHGMRPMTPDGLPIVGRLAPDSNVLVASGHGMLGLTLAPSTAVTVRDLCRDSPDARLTQDVVQAYGPQRFLARRARRASVA